MNNYISIYNGHKKATVEHGFKPLPHKILVQMICDSLFRYTLCRDGAYVVYEIVNKRTIGTRFAMITSLYCPIEKRGTGIISELLDMITLPVLNTRGKDEDEVARLYLRRKP